jgi:hypothetical protein
MFQICERRSFLLVLRSFQVDLCFQTHRFTLQWLALRGRPAIAAIACLLQMIFSGANLALRRC